MIALELIGVIWFVSRVVAFGLIGGLAGFLAAFVYRNRIRSDLPETAALVIGLGVVAIYLNTRIVFTQFVGGEGDPLAVDTALANTTILIVAAITSLAGRSVGHRVADSERFTWTTVTPTLSPIVRATGRYISVTLPDSIEDIDGYDPVSTDAKAALAGRTLEFSRGLTVGELETALVTRLTEKHDIGYVDVDVEADGTVTYLALGQRAAGLGKTLPPGTGALALRADPPFSSSPGDTVEIWSDGVSRGMAELRAVVEDVVTIAADDEVCEAIDPTESYRLVTHPGDAHPDREFAGMLRRSAETMRVIEIAERSVLTGSTVGSIDVVVIGIERPEEAVTIPKRSVRIQAGDRLCVIGRPERLRRLEEAARSNSR